MARMPLYKTAETEMIRRIETSEWEEGRRLPNEFVLAAEFGVSQGTMRRALMTLEGRGLLSRKPGRGTIVTRREANGAEPPAAPVPASTLLKDGEPPAFEVHRARAGSRGADASETALFGTGRLSSLERLLKVGAARAGLEEIAVPEPLAPALDEEAPVDFTELLAGHGLDPAGISEEIGADITTMGESVTLACDRHTPLLTVTRIARDGRGRPIARQSLRLIAAGLTWAPAR
jgi:GntR family transcriptional regulator